MMFLFSKLNLNNLAQAKVTNYNHHQATQQDKQIIKSYLKSIQTQFKREMSLFVGNVSKHVTLKQLETLFKKYGKCKIDLRDRYAFVQFDNDNHGQAAKKELQHETFHGLELNIEWSKNSGRFGENNKRKNGGGNERKRSRSRENRWRRQDNWGRRSPQYDRKAPSYSGNTDIESFEPKCPRDQIILQKLKAKAKEYEQKHSKQLKHDGEKHKLQPQQNGASNSEVIKNEMQEQVKVETSIMNLSMQEQEGMIQEDGEITTQK